MYFYKGLIRPTLEYGLVSCSGSKPLKGYRGYRSRPEKGPTRLIPSIKHLPYEDRLQKLPGSCPCLRSHTEDVQETWYRCITTYTACVHTCNWGPTIPSERGENNQRLLTEATETIPQTPIQTGLLQSEGRQPLEIPFRVCCHCTKSEFL